MHEEFSSGKSEIAAESSLPVSPPPVEKRDFVIPSELFARRGRTFSIINQKGGCGKTTTAINLGASLAKEGFDVLLIDLDPQANATVGLGLRSESESKTAYNLFKDPNIAPFDLVHPTALEHLHLVPGSRLLSSLAVELLKSSNWEYLLRSFLRSVKQSYHYLFIDCPPALNAMTLNALTASDEMIIPIQTHYFSLEGMKELFLTVQSVRERLNPLLGNGMILATLFDKRPKITQEMLRSIRDYFKEQVFETVIGVNIRLVEACMHGQPALVYDPHSRGAREYRALAYELIKREAVLLPEEKVEEAKQG